MGVPFTEEDKQFLQETFATKADLKVMESGIRSDMATKKDLKTFATKADLGQFATKQDLERFVTKEEAKAFATKADLERFATKGDLDHAVEVLEQKIERRDLNLQAELYRRDLELKNYITREIDGLARAIQSALPSQQPQIDTHG